MDFIERFFGVSPDGGDGSTELLYLATAVILAALIAWRPLRKKFSERQRVDQK
jgi:hypothetical protein